MRGHREWVWHGAAVIFSMYGWLISTADIAEELGIMAGDLLSRGAGDDAWLAAKMSALRKAADQTGEACWWVTPQTPWLSTKIKPTSTSFPWEDPTAMKIKKFVEAKGSATGALAYRVAEKTSLCDALKNPEEILRVFYGRFMNHWHTVDHIKNPFETTGQWQEFRSQHFGGPDEAWRHFVAPWLEELDRIAAVVESFRKKP